MRAKLITWLLRRAWFRAATEKDVMQSRLVKRVRAAVLRLRLKRVTAQQREVVADLVWAVSTRQCAERMFVKRSLNNNTRKEALQRELDALTKELA